MDTPSFISLPRARLLMVVIAIIAGLAFLFLGAGGQAVRSSQAAFPGANGKIAFADASGIRTIEADGSGEKSLLSGASALAWSPDGKQIAYVAPHDSGVGIYIADADGSNPQYLTTGAHPAWSPDGKKLVYLGGPGGLWICDLATKTETQLTHLDTSATSDYHDMPAWQPGGNKIVFLRVRHVEAHETLIYHYDLWLVNADGSGLSQLTDAGVADDEADPGQDYDPSWSPDGREILFMRNTTEVGIYTVSQAGGFLAPLKSTPGSSPDPAWSPDGNKIAYIRFNSATEPDTYELHVMKSNGNDDQTVITKTAMIVQLDWGVSSVTHEFVVNSANNLSDDDPGDGACDTGVDLPGGDPECTLLAAVEESNALVGKDKITFDIPGSSVPLIAAPDGFDLTDPVVIDGTTQPGGAKVEIDGGFSYGMACGPISEPERNGFTILAGNSQLKGLVIHGFCDWGIVLRGRNNVIEGNFIGANPAGTHALGNGGMWIGGSYPSGWEGGGISIESSDNLIGGADHTPGVCDGACNLISGNSLSYGQKGGWDKQTAGIRIIYLGTENNTIFGNFIGTDITGRSAPVGSTQQRFGIEIYDARGSVIGGSTLGEGNTISGNMSFGIFLHESSSIHPSPNNIIRGNFIGVDAAGTLGVYAEQSGVRIEESYENRVLNNVIASRDGGWTGVVLSGEAASKNIVQNNLIGTAADGATRIGISAGVILQAGAHENTITNNTIAYGYRGVLASLSSDNQISANRMHDCVYGIEAISGAVEMEIFDNVIHHNQAGVRMQGDETIHNRISANAIYANFPGLIGTTTSSGLGIDLLPDGPNTPNDFGDYDAGANTGLNFPVLGFATQSASGDLRTGGSYDSSLGSHPYRLEFFANTACDNSDFGEGERFLGFADVTTDISGRAVVEFTKTQAGVGSGQFVTAVAIDEYGNTSEFSHCVEIQPGDSLATAAGTGSHEIQVADARSFRVGDFIRLNPGGTNQEEQQVTGFGSLLLAGPLQFAHAAGEPVVVISKRVYLPMLRR